MSITIKLLLTIITTTTPSTSEVPDLCDVVDSATGVPSLCAPHPDGAPIFGHNVCCTTESCVPAGPTCETASLYFCELGQKRADGKVSCYVEVPSYCDTFPCVPGFEAQPINNAMCCSQGICWPTVTGSNDCEFQDIYWCSNGVSNPDGTVTCFDDEES